MESTRERSLWLRTAPGPRRPVLEGELEVDVAIVGGGITGITAAVLLQAEGLRVAVVEALEIAGGTTGYTTAHFTSALDSRYTLLESRFGREGARLAAASQQAAIDQVGFLVGNHHLDCGWRRLPAYLYSYDTNDDEIAREYEASRRAGLDVELLHAAPLPYRSGSAVRFHHQGTLHPRRYVLALAERFVANGGLVFENSRVMALSDGDPCEVTTASGRVRAKHVFVASHAPLNRVFLQTKVAAYRSYVIAFTTRHPLTDALYFDTLDPYHYVRQEQVDGETYVLVGGEDHKVGHEQDTTRPLFRLEEWISDRFEVERITDRWSAQVLEPVDGLAYIGRNSGDKHVSIATGFSGNGMTNGTLAAMLVRDRITGQRNPWHRLYEATRIKPLASLRDFVRENVDYPLHLAGDLVRPAQTKDLDEVPPGEGRIVQRAGEKLAVYRSEAGELTALSPVCTHLFCDVGWNAAEKSWDCPCHGSRFDTDGTVLDGPAVKALERRPLEPDEEERRPTPPDTHVPAS